MFPVDTVKPPALNTRRGLMIVDAQNDFLSSGGALPVKNPRNLPQRIAGLVTAFRQSGGVVIWVHSQFDKPRSAESEQIVTSDGPMLTGASASGRGQRPRAPPQGIEDSRCPEAFLGPEATTRPKCVRVGSPGIELHPTVQEAVHPRDLSVVKSHYSAFQSEPLLQLLRRRLVTELFICGSLTNIGVMASAVGAASHGYSIAIIEDCCGYRSSMRHNSALQKIEDATGCDILTAEDALAISQPPSRPSQRSSNQQPSRIESSDSTTVRRRTEEEDAISSLTSKLESSFEKLSLNSDPVADGPRHELRGDGSKRPLQSAAGAMAGANEVEKKDKEKEKEAPQGPSSDDDAVPQSDPVDLNAPQQSSAVDESESDDSVSAEAEVAAAQGSAKRSEKDSDEESNSGGSGGGGGAGGGDGGGAGSNQ